MCQHMWTCRYVLICADMCQHVTSLSVPMMPIICTWSAFQYVSAHVDMPTCAYMCWHVLTCDIILGTSDANHLDLISMLTYVCQHIWTCRHVSICVNICWHVPACANMWNHSWHLWYQPFGPYLHAGMCQHMWTCRDVLICTDRCRYVPTCADVGRHVPMCANI